MYMQDANYRLASYVFIWAFYILYYNKNANAIKIDDYRDYKLALENFLGETPYFCLKALLKEYGEE